MREKIRFFFLGYEESSNGKLMHMNLRIAQLILAVHAIYYLITFIIALVKGDGGGLQCVFAAIICAGIAIAISSRLD